MATLVDLDRRMSIARQKLDWDGMTREGLDPDIIRERLQVTEDRQACSMCGRLCAVKISRAAWKPVQKGAV